MLQHDKTDWWINMHELTVCGFICRYLWETVCVLLWNLRLFPSPVCQNCSFWHCRGVAGTSPWVCPLNQPSPELCSSLQTWSDREETVVQSETSQDCCTSGVPTCSWLEIYYFSSLWIIFPPLTLLNILDFILIICPECSQSHLSTGSLDKRCRRQF